MTQNQINFSKRYYADKAKGEDNVQQRLYIEHLEKNCDHLNPDGDKMYPVPVFGNRCPFCGKMVENE